MRFSHWLLPWFVMATCTSAAWGQDSPEAPPAPVAPSPVAPDVVVLHDNSMLRGTIAELKTGESVVIMLITGEVRTIPWADVRYAGPEADRPKPPSTPPHAPVPPQSESKPAAPSRDSPRPFVTVRAQEAPFNFTAKPGDEPVTLHVHAGSSRLVSHGLTSDGRAATVVGKADSYTSICTAPCSATLPAGTHRLALSQGKGSPVEPDDPVHLAGPSAVHGEYTSRSGTRFAGYAIALGSGLAGATLMVLSREEKRECETVSGGGPLCSTTYERNTAKFYGGAGLALAGILVGVVIAMTPDDARITVSPAKVSDTERGDDLVGLPNGATLTGSF